MNNEVKIWYHPLQNLFINLIYSASRSYTDDPNLRKCNNNHLVSFIKVEGLFVPYIVHIFDTIKSRT